MTAGYQEFLAAKRQHYGAEHRIDPDELPDWLYPFQRELTAWALTVTRGAILADCGLGKTPMQLAWADFVYRLTGRPTLLVTPLAVSYQTEHEAGKFGIEAGVSRIGKPGAAITITNYERLHLFDPEDFGSIVADESSAIKAFDGVTRALVTEFMRRLVYRLLCSATAAPNDYIELGTSSEALGYLGYTDMLSRFFTNDQRVSHRLNEVKGGKRSEWRFKGHAEQPFWRWVSSWARALRRPSDLGYDDGPFVLPELIQRQHVVEASSPSAGTLFTLPAVGLKEEREEQRRTLTERCEKVAELLGTADRAIAWCELNAEGDLLTSMIEGAVQVKGSDAAESKEEALTAFTRGELRVLVTKPSIGGWGLNWQHCHRMTFFPSHSFEQYYQAVRRCWRFGQQHPVTVDIVTTEGGANALRNLERKAAQAERMFDALIAQMRNAQGIEHVHYEQDVEVPAWLS